MARLKLMSDKGGAKPVLGLRLHDVDKYTEKVERLAEMGIASNDNVSGQYAHRFDGICLARDQRPSSTRKSPPSVQARTWHRSRCTVYLAGMSDKLGDVPGDG